MTSIALPTAAVSAKGKPAPRKGRSLLSVLAAAMIESRMRAAERELARIGFRQPR